MSEHIRIGYLGAGAWSFALATMLAGKGHEVIAWGRERSLINYLIERREHPKFPGFEMPKPLYYTHCFEEAFQNVDLLVEGVTGAGVRTVFEQAAPLLKPGLPIILTSKGIEQGSDLLLSDVVLDVLGERFAPDIGCVSGPSLAVEVLKKCPTSVVGASENIELAMRLAKIFSTPYFHVHPLTDIKGVEFGGAMKNIVAIACGICTGMGFGNNTKGALIARGWAEVRSIARYLGYDEATLAGLSGMGDLCATCMSGDSRNSTLGVLLAQGLSLEEASKKIGMVVEGAYTCVSAWQLVQKAGLDCPIIEVIYEILEKGMSPTNALQLFLGDA
jgi:glycerol-3-phosphate dehydrogenase (NAD(P)+)